MKHILADEPPRKKRMRSFIGFDCPEEMYERFKAEATKRGVPVAILARVAINDLLRRA